MAALKLSPSHLERTMEDKPHLKQYADRLRAMDKDGNGELDLAEVCEVLDEMATIEKQKRLLKWMAIISGIFALLSIAAIVGLTYAVVDLSKDTQVSNGLMLTKDGAPLTMGTYRVSGDLVVDEETYIEPSTARRRALLQTQDEIDAYIDGTAGKKITGCWKILARTLTDITTSALGESTERDLVATCTDLKQNGVTTTVFSLVEKTCRVPPCETAIVPVTVTSHICDALLNVLRPPTPEIKAATEANICSSSNYPVEVDSNGKITSSWPIITGYMVDEEGHSKPTVIRLKANCSSIAEPKFIQWFDSGELQVPKACSVLAPPPPPTVVPAASPPSTPVVEPPSPVRPSRGDINGTVVTGDVKPRPGNTSAVETVVETTVIQAGDK